MDRPKIKFGVWHPEAGFPEIEEGSLDFGAWYSLEAGKIEELSFDKGDWLVYLYDSNSSEKAHWEKSKGLAVYSPLSENNDNDIEIDPGTFTKVRVDDKGNVVEGGYITYDDLPSDFRKDLEEFKEEGLKEQVIDILKEAFLQSYESDLKIGWDESRNAFNFEVNIDGYTITRDDIGRLQAESSGSGTGGSGDCANHTHTPDDIIGLDEYILNIISSFNIIAEVQNNLDKLVDGTTVVVNSNGKLAAIAMEVGPHTHTIDDILGLDKEKISVWASDQLLHNNLDFNKGELQLQNESLGSSIYYINNSLKDIKKIAEDAAATANGEIDPGTPGQLKEAELFTIGDTRKLFDFKLRKDVNCYSKLKVSTKSILYLNKKFIYNVYIDEIKVASLDTSKITRVGDYGEGFTVTYVGEAYPTIKTFQGKYEGISFDWEYAGDLAEGYHDFRIEEILDNSKVSEKVILDIPIFKNVENLYFDASWPQDLLYTKVSGVSRYSGLATYAKIPIKIYCINERFVPLWQLKIKNSLKHNEEIFDLRDSIYSKEILFNYNVDFPKVDGKIDLVIATQNCDGVIEEKTISSKYFHYDNTYLEEDFRVQRKRNDLSYERYEDFNSERELATDECLFENNIARITKDDFTENGIGPDYSNHEDSQSFVLKFPLQKAISNFYFDIKKKMDNVYERDKYGQLKNIEIKACLSDNDFTANWIDCNKYWIKDTVYQEGSSYSGLDLFRSSPSRRWITLGKQNFIKRNYLYLKIKLSKEGSIDLEALAKSIKECIDER